MVDGQKKRLWKTTFAAKYVPSFCLKLATILSQCAPEEALGGQMDPIWQTLLMQVTGLVDHPVPLPTCPSTFTTGWEAGTNEWSRGIKNGVKCKEKETEITVKAKAKVKAKVKIVKKKQRW